MRSPGRTCRPWQPRRCRIGAHDSHFSPLQTPDVLPPPLRLALETSGAV